MSSITVIKDLRSRFGAARDQGARPTCLAFAMSDAHASVRAPGWEPLSCEYLFYKAKQRDHTPVGMGTTLGAVRGALREDGQPVESVWPYLNGLAFDPSSWQPPALVPELYRRDSATTGAAFEESWCSIENNTPVVLAMTLSPAFFTPDSDGLVDTIEPPVPPIRHAVVVVAIGDTGSQRVLLVRNSWGVSWGTHGYAWLSEQYVADKISVTITLEEHGSCI